MLIDSILIFVVMRRLWNWPLWLAVAIAAPLTLIDLAFLASNSLKILDGGWFPLVIGAVVFTLLTTWKRGRALLMDKLSTDALPLDVFIQSIEVSPPTRVEGTAVFMTSTPDRVPHALLHNLKHNKVLHERVVLLTVVMRDIPYVRARGPHRDQAAGLRLLPDPRVLRVQGGSGRARAARGVRAAAASCSR